MGSSKNLIYFSNFSLLTELLLANTDSLISFEYKGCFLTALKNSLGKQLKSLHLTYLVDVNLRSLAKHCTNLQKLTVDFISYYEPAYDSSLDTSDLNAEIINNQIGMANLRFLSLSNLNNKYEHRHLNIGQFKKDLKLLMSHSNLEKLSLNGLSDLDNEYFVELFTTEAPVKFRINLNLKLIIDKIELIELNEINNITPETICELLILAKNSLKSLSLINCKLINKTDFYKFLNVIKYKSLDCNIKWV